MVVRLDWESIDTLQGKRETDAQDVGREGGKRTVVVAGAATEAAIYCEAAHHRGAADGFRDIGSECRRIAADAERLAPIFAPPVEERA